MVPLVEDQIHQRFKNLEEERCRKLEAAHKLDEPTNHKTVERRAVPKPWKAFGRARPCQAADLLVFVTQYDYDLKDETFQQYCVARGTLHVAGKPGSRRWDHFVEHSRAKDEYMADPYFHFAEEWQGERCRFTQAELEFDGPTVEGWGSE